MKRRVVITGLGSINPLADNLDDFYKNLIAGKSGMKQFTSIDLSQVECKIGGDLGDYNTQGALEKHKDYLSPERYKVARKLFRNTTFSARLASLAALDAWENAGLHKIPPLPYRTSVLVPGHNLNSNYIFENSKQFQKDPEWMNPLAGIEAIDPNVPAIITEILGVKGPSFTIGGACASGNLALREGFRDIVTGECDRAIIAGAPFDVSPQDIQASVIIQAVVIKPEYQNRPQEASRPFDKNRCGFLYSHGAATLILEDLESAQKRGAFIWGELLGVKAGSNANHLPMPGAEDQEAAMRGVLQMSGIKPEQVDYVNCHATGTPVGDLQEIKAIKATFGEHAKNLKLNAPKSMLGHTCWASPLVETVGGLLQMKNGMLHPTINIDEQDPLIDLDICAQKAVKHQIRYMLKNSFGFGGINCCSLIKKYEDLP